MLSEAERKTYDETGYVIPEFRLPEQKLATLRHALDDVIERNPHVRQETLTGLHLRGRDANGVEGHRAFLDIALDDDMVGLAASVLGEDVVFWGSQAFCKPANDGYEVPMHQDGAYWPIRPLATCTIWIALDKADRDNGCLTVIPGSHIARRHYRHRTDERDRLVLNQAVDDPELDDRPASYVELEPGQMSLHDVHLVHGSGPNRSGRRRAGLTLRYMPATSWFRRDIEIPFAGYPVDFSNRPIWLVRGRDVSGKNDFSVGHDD